MNKVIREKTSNYTTISNVFLKDKNLSLKAKGFLTVVMALPENWDFTIKGICSILKEGKTAIYGVVQELKESRYCKTTPNRDEKGLILGLDYVFYEEPYKEEQDKEEQDKEEPQQDYPRTENRDMDNVPQISTYSIKPLIDESFKKDIDKSISKSNYQQGCGTSLSPSVAPQHLSAASSGVSSPCSSDDAFAPLTFEEEEATNKGATACGVNVNPLQTPLPPTPMMSSDVDVDDADNSNAKKFKRKKYKAKFDVYADLSYVDEAYADIWREWLEYKDAINKQYNVQKGAIIQYKSLLKYADNNVILANAIVKKSIEHSWNGLFGLSDKDKELYLSERSPYYVKSNEPKLPNGWDRERYDMYIRNGFEITEDGKLYKNGKLYK